LAAGSNIRDLPWWVDEGVCGIAVAIATAMRSIRSLFALFAVSSLCIGSAACALQSEADEDTSADEALTGSSYDPFKNLDADLGEKLWPNEKKDIQATAEIITRS
jgi:hypothetical protein